MNVTFALAEETTLAIGKDGGNFGHNRKRDFFGCFAADVESGGREQVSDTGVEIEGSIFAETGQ